MIQTLILAASLFTGSAGAVEPGVYTLIYRVASDVGQTQEIELANFRPRGSKKGSFDVRISTPGGAKRFPEDSQIVQGIYYDGTFTFILPFANVVNVMGYKFVGIDAEKDGVYKGTVHIFGYGERDVKEGPFAFGMKKGPDLEGLKHRAAKAARK